MFKKKILATIFATFLLCTGVNRIEAETILYVPQDDRPVSLSYTVSTAEDAGYTVITPPKHLISGFNFHGEADEIWQWVDENAKKADIMVLSTDTLIYGGLVDSRKHNIPFPKLQQRLEKIKELQKIKNTPIYAFGTVMRSPRASGGGVEPAYYSQFGPSIFRITALQDKKDLKGISPAEEAELFSLVASVPVEYLQDWFDRRRMNMTINQELIQLVRDHTFNYFALGHDDTSYLSQSALESRYLRDFSKGLSYKEYGSFPGADQLGLLLIARAHVDLNHLHPTFETIYPLGGAQYTIPHYEDQSVGLTISQHIEAVGGSEITSGKPQYLLAVNTPLSKETGEAEYFGNLPMQSPVVMKFVDYIQQAINENVTVGVADISYSNGSSNLLTKALQEKGLLYKVGAYNGWNTASNTVGYTIAQVILSKAMTPEKHKDMLTQQYLDNWGYQANVRKDIYRMQEELRTSNVRYTGRLTPEMLEQLKEEIQEFAARELHIDKRKVDASFPWNRLFETDIVVYDEPIAPDYKAERIAREKAEEEARIKAEEAKKKALEEAKKAGKTIVDGKIIEDEQNKTADKTDKDADKTVEKTDKAVEVKNNGKA